MADYVVMDEAGLFDSRRENVLARRRPCKSCACVTYTHTHTHTHTHIYIYVYIYIHMYIYIYVDTQRSGILYPFLVVGSLIK